MHSLIPLTLAAAITLLVGCASPDSRPVAGTEYPASYAIRLGVPSGGESANRGHEGHHTRVEVVPRELLYYRVNSPVDVTVSVYERDREGQRSLLGQMRGTSFTTSVMPSTSSVEFSVIPTQATATGVVQFVVSDAPIATHQIAALAGE